MFTVEFSNIYYTVHCTNSLSLKQKIPVSETVRTRNISFLSTILRLYIQIALSRKPFGIGHMFIQTFLLRMTDTMNSQNIDLSSWDTLYNLYICVEMSILTRVEKLTGSQLAKKFPAFYGTRKFMTGHTSVRQLSLS